ncbi:MAG TPA: hypothetical protein PK668_05635 [Myxococcota bacterium]|nr:hypothetical protein [Myxococcota bacterium]HRY92678.1 hypothetical protein [Myxococcota bacterium]HSA21638.1 hypothetical protein [Myxococcota bacterium]
MRTLVWIGFLGLLAGGCLEYGTGDERPACETLGDCNPGETCGALTDCVAGRCDPAQVVQIPCVECQTDADCGAGARCVEGACAAVGACQSVSECWEFEADCQGWLACRDSWCQYTCFADETCQEDSDCALVGTNCCCNFRVSDFAAIRTEHEAEYATRPDCWAVDCPPMECVEPQGLRAACQAGRCAVVQDPVDDLTSCREDADCVVVPISCPSCDCHAGYREFAVRADHEARYLADLEAECALAGACMTGPFGPVDACTGRPAVCLEGRCEVLGQGCECPDVWDPVCAGAGGVSTFPNACQAACAGFQGELYHGRCECQMDCDCGDPLYDCSACATNGQTYLCGLAEARCNGFEVLYPGACEPACDFCGMLGRPSVPVCGFDFYGYADSCYADCLGRPWWHTGACDPGEGALCGGIAGEECSSEELFCMLDEWVPDSQGHCVRPLTCYQPEHCLYQVVGPPPGCEPVCQEHACAWPCD